MRRWSKGVSFSGPQVRDLLEGKKTIIIWRVVCPQPLWVGSPAVPFRTTDADPKGIIKGPFGTVGDLLYVKETHVLVDGACWGGLPHLPGPNGQVAYYREGFDRSPPTRWRQSNHMPQWAARFWVRVVAVGIERARDAVEEGSTSQSNYNTIKKAGYKTLDNPWVWRGEFELTKRK